MQLLDILITKARKWDLFLVMCRRLGIAQCEELRDAINEKVDGHK